MSETTDPLTFQAQFFALHPDALSVMGLFEYLPSARFYAKTRESRFVRVNSAFLEPHGAKHERDMLGKTDRDFHPPALAEAYIAEDQRVMRGARPIPNQVWLVPHFRGMPQWYVSSKTPLFDAAGDVIGIAGVMYPIDTPREQTHYFRELTPVITHIEQHYTETISMEEMAKLADLSPTHFNRRFRALLRMSPTQYVHALRIQQAQRMLSQTHDPVSDIAIAMGYFDQSHFTKRFRRVTGLTPQGYRKRFR
ncbi:MAG: helix-turn-helix domain-containing protein [Phycisphaera sp.]|nr:helix-turn-helix domain-containing protein [Phycisphaera sp.]